MISKSQRRLIERNLMASGGLDRDEAYEASILFMHSGREAGEALPLKKVVHPTQPAVEPPLGMEMYS